MVSKKRQWFLLLLKGESHTPACGGSRLSNVLAGTAFQALDGQVHGAGRRERWAQRGLLTSSFLCRDASPWRLPSWGHLLKPTEKSLSYKLRRVYFISDFPEITHKPRAVRRNRFWQISFNVHYGQKFAELKASTLKTFRLDLPTKCFLRLQISGGTDKKQEWDVLLELDFQEHGEMILKVRLQLSFLI